MRHYSQCTSFGEIVVVWNRGPLPRPGQDLVSRVPLRVRAEPHNSMANRLRPDPELRFRGVLFLDDDVVTSCADLGGCAALHTCGNGTWQRPVPQQRFPSNSCLLGTHTHTQKILHQQANSPEIFPQCSLLLWLSTA